MSSIRSVPARTAPKVGGLVLSLLLVLTGARPDVANAATADDNVEWTGVSHYSWMDRRPLCPVDGQTFEVRMQAFKNDLTGARVFFDDGSTTWITAAATETRGPYDVWTAQIPATAAAACLYYFELTDGIDVDYYSVSGMSDTTPVDGGFLIDYTTLSHAPVGATKLDGETVFRVWNPAGTTVTVPGEFNGWTFTNALTQVGDHFIGRVPGATSRQQYKYHLNGSIWKPDARARALNATDNQNSYIEDPFGYSWGLVDFQTPPFEEMVIYQLHVGTFAGRNDPLGNPGFPAGYVDVADRAAHLAELGINAVMLNPITEFQGDESAGYNPVTAWAPEWVYGTPDDLKYMVDQLHQNGIAVILDIVWNHMGFGDNYLWQYNGSQIYFDDPAIETPWGAQCDFDAGEVRSYYLQSAHYWLEEFKMDGFRMDATDFMNIPPQDGSGWSLMQALNDQVDNRSADKITIAEQLPDDAFVTRPTSLGGAGFDSQYHDAFTDRLREEIFDAALGDPEMWKIDDIINGSGAFLNGRYVTNYVELHDEAWPTSGGQRLVKTIDTTAPHDDAFAQGRSKLAQGLTMFTPGIPAMLQGTEWLEDTDFGTSSGNRIDWSKKTTYAHIFQYYQDIIALRTSNPALRADSPHAIFHFNETGNVIGFQRYDFAGNVIVVLANFSNNDYTNYRIGLPQPDQWTEMVNSQSSVYGGNGLDNPGLLTAEAIAADGFGQSIELNVPQMGLLVLQWGDETSSAPPVPGGPTARLVTLEHLGPNPMSEETALRLTLARDSVVSMTVHDASGRMVDSIAAGHVTAGSHEVTWDRHGRGDRRLPAGVYTVLVRTEQGQETTKITVLD